MSDRKYRQHGYQDEGKPSRTPSPKKAPDPYDPRIPRDPRVPNMPGFREIFRCARCGHLEAAAITADSACAGCGVPLHACIHCASFDSGAPFECRQTIPARVTPKDARNACALYASRLTVERETGSAPATSSSSNARKAFDDLFKF